MDILDIFFLFYSLLVSFLFFSLLIYLLFLSPFIFWRRFMCTFGFFFFEQVISGKLNSAKMARGLFFFLVIGAVFSFGVMLCGFLFCFFSPLLHLRFIYSNLVEIPTSPSSKLISFPFYSSILGWLIPLLCHSLLSGLVRAAACGLYIIFSLEQYV